jgi:hypothetical protein
MIKPIAFGTLTLLGLLSTAQAQTNHQYMVSGHACNPGKTDVSKMGYSTAQGIGNDSTTATAKAYCPIVYDVLSGSDPNFIQVMVLDNSDTANISCTLNAVRLDGSIAFSQTQTSAGAQVGVRFAINFTPPILSDIFSYGFSCTLPAKTSSPASRIMFYSIFHN